jgi:hypothetical protein
VKLPEKQNKPVDPKAVDIITGNQPQPSPAPKNPDRPGRPKKGETWAELISDELDREGVTGVSARREIVRRARELAKAGVPWAIEWLANREEGKPKQQIDLAGKDGGPLTINVVKYSDAEPNDEPKETEPGA